MCAGRTALVARATRGGFSRRLTHDWPQRLLASPRSSPHSTPPSQSRPPPPPVHSSLPLRRPRVSETPQQLGAVKRITRFEAGLSFSTAASPVLSFFAALGKLRFFMPFPLLPTSPIEPGERCRMMTTTKTALRFLKRLLSSKWRLVDESEGESTGIERMDKR